MRALVLLDTHSARLLLPAHPPSLLACPLNRRSDLPGCCPLSGPRGDVPGGYDGLEGADRGGQPTGLLAMTTKSHCITTTAAFCVVPGCLAKCSDVSMHQPPYRPEHILFRSTRALLLSGATGNSSYRGAAFVGTAVVVATAATTTAASVFAGRRIES